jgi:hypothetical protein
LLQLLVFWRFWRERFERISWHLLGGESFVKNRHDDGEE